MSLGFFEFGWPAQDLRTEVRDIVKRKARFCKLVLDLMPSAERSIPLKVEPETL